VLRHNYDSIFLRSPFPAKNITLIYDNGNQLIFGGSDKAVAKRVDSGATLFSVDENGAGTKLHRRNMDSFNMYIRGELFHSLNKAMKCTALVTKR